jgi:hypothetical protein
LNVAFRVANAVSDLLGDADLNALESSLFEAIGAYETISIVETELRGIAFFVAVSVAYFFRRAGHDRLIRPLTERNAHSSDSLFAFLADNAVATVQEVLCVIALRVAYTISNRLWQAHFDALAMHLGKAQATDQAISVIEVELRHVADLIANSIANGKRVAETNTLRATPLIAWIADDAVAIIELELSEVAFCVACTISNILR